MSNVIEISSKEQFDAKISSSEVVVVKCNQLLPRISSKVTMRPFNTTELADVLP